MYAENARTIVAMDSPIFGRVMNVCIGAMMVGSIKFTKNEGEEVKRAEEYGTSLSTRLGPIAEMHFQATLPSAAVPF